VDIAQAGENGMALLSRPTVLLRYFEWRPDYQDKPAVNTLAMFDQGNLTVVGAGSGRARAQVSRTNGEDERN